ncbi:MAG: hypothetical protein JWM68_955 [Verrucomicrobiales bacterium]|nr:hypothetical protein [Verrucomicrobiales bacterium]
MQLTAHFPGVGKWAGRLIYVFQEPEIRLED